MKHTLKHQAGDTIVEVIIAVAIIASILAGAFVVTNRSTRAVRDSEEHAQALQLLQGQVELLRYAASQPGWLTAPRLSNISTPFCIDNTGIARQPASSQNQCLVSTQGVCTAATQAVCYRVAISSANSTPNAGSTTTFNLTATWSALGGGTDKVYLSYNVEVTP